MFDLPPGFEGTCTYAGGVSMSNIFAYEEEVPFLFVGPDGQEHTVGVPWDRVAAVGAISPGPMQPWLELSVDERFRVVELFADIGMVLVIRDGYARDAFWHGSVGAGAKIGLEGADASGVITVSWTDPAGGNDIMNLRMPFDDLWCATGRDWALLYRGEDGAVLANQDLAALVLSSPVISEGERAARERRGDPDATPRRCIQSFLRQRDPAATLAWFDHPGLKGASQVESDSL
jgi:hypothetical protein